MGAPVPPVRPDGRPQPPRPRGDATIQAPLDALQGVAFADGDANVAAVADAGPGPHRASPLGILPQMAKLLVAFGIAGIGLIASILGGEMDPDEVAMTGFGLLAFAAALVLSLASVVLTWYTHTWELADDALVLRSGLFVRNARRIPYQRVHSVDLSSSVLERVLGLTTLTVDTGASEAGAAKNAVKYMKRTQAEALKRALFARKTLLTKEEAVLTGAVSGQTSVGEKPSASPEPVADPAGDVAYELQLSNRLHLLASVTDLNMGAAFVSAIGALFGALQFAEPFIGTLMYDAIAEAIMGAFDGIAEQFTAAQVLSLLPAALVGVLAVGVAFAVLTWAISAVLAFVRWGGFVLRRRGSRVEVSSGLLSRTTRAVDLSRVQSVHVDRSLLRRLLGYAQVSVDVVAVGEGSSQRASVVFHPCIPVAEVPAFLAETLPAFAQAAAPATPDEGLDRLPAAALRRTVLHGIYWTVAAVAVVAAFTWLIAGEMTADPVDQTLGAVAVALSWSCVLVVCVAMFVVRVLAWRLRRIGTRGSVLVLVNGGVTHRVSYTARTKLQSLSRRVTPFQARARVATIKGRTACVSAEKDPHMRDVAAARAAALMVWARPHYDNAAEAERALREAGL